MDRLIALVTATLLLAASAGADEPARSRTPGPAPLATDVSWRLPAGDERLLAARVWLPRRGDPDEALAEDPDGGLSPVFSFAVEPGPYPFSRHGDPADEKGRYQLGLRLTF